MNLQPESANSQAPDASILLESQRRPHFRDTAAGRDDNECSVKVAVRVRPCNVITCRKCVSVDDSATCLRVEQASQSLMQDSFVQSKTFSFDYVADVHVGQKWGETGSVERRTSTFYLVDLAGSERQKRTESSGLRLKEASCINKSLSALGNVIKALVDNSEGRTCHIPYRDSKLTYLLKDALGGNSKCALIANISPAAINIDETLSTLKFAQRAKLMHNLAVLNEDDSPGSVEEELKCLRLEVTALRVKLGRVLLNGHRRSSVSRDYGDQGRIRRIESILTQLSKDILVSEKKSIDEMHALSLKVEATKTLCQKIDKLLQIYNLQQSLDQCIPKKLNKNIIPRSLKSLTKEEVMSQFQQALDRCVPKKFKEMYVRRSRKSSLTATEVSDSDRF